MDQIIFNKLFSGGVERGEPVPYKQLFISWSSDNPLTNAVDGTYILAKAVATMSCLETKNNTLIYQRRISRRTFIDVMSVPISLRRSIQDN